MNEKVSLYQKSDKFVFDFHRKIRIIMRNLVNMINIQQMANEF